jgi:hypothetical protein
MVMYDYFEEPRESWCHEGVAAALRRESEVRITGAADARRAERSAEIDRADAHATPSGAGHRQHYASSNGRGSQAGRRHGEEGSRYSVEGCADKMPKQVRESDSLTKVEARVERLEMLISGSPAPAAATPAAAAPTASAGPFVFAALPLPPNVEQQPKREELMRKVNGGAKMKKK